MQAQPVPTCSKCKRTYEIGNGNKGTCKPCNNKRSLLSQMFGGWPCPLFDELTPDQQVAFWCADLKSKNALQVRLCEDVSKVREDIETKRVKGEYLPLSVYEKRGYPAPMLEAIERNCPSRMDDTLEVTTYKLEISESIVDTIRKEVKSEVIGSRCNDLRGKLSHYASPLKNMKKKKKSSKKKSKKSASSSSGGSSKSSKSSKSSDGSNSSDSPKPPPKYTKRELAAMAKKEAVEAKRLAATAAKLAAVQVAAAKKRQAKEAADLAAEAKRLKKDEGAAGRKAAAERAAQAKKELGYSGTVRKMAVTTAHVTNLA
jgi:hypothetical protein